MSKNIWVLVLSLALVVSCATFKVSYEGGDGSFLDTAIIVKAPNEYSGVKAEADWISQNHPGWKKKRQGLLTSGDRSYDRIDYTTPEGETRTIYYDITSFFGKRY